MKDTATVVQLKSVFTKRIPLRNVQSFEGTNPRREIIQDRVLFFIELYKNDADRAIDPIEVLLIQTGDPKSSIYLILEGLHRYEALKRLKASEVLANVHMKPSYSISDLDDRRVRGKILEMSCPYNSKSPMPLTLQERIAAARELHELGYCDEDISEALGAGERTIRRWLEEIKKGEKQKLKEEIVDRLRKGESVNELARQYKDRLSELTILNWKKEASAPSTEEVKNWPHVQNYTPSDSGVVSKFPKPLFPGGDLLPDLDLRTKLSALEMQTDELTEAKQEEIIAKLTKICDVLRSLDWFDDADDLVIVHLLPILDGKSDKLRKVISTGGYALLYEELKGLYDEEHSLLKASNEECVKKDEAIRQLEQELSLRHEECKHDCEYSRDWLREEFDRSVEYLLSNLCVLKDALREGYIPDIKKRPLNIPKEARPAIHQLALNAGYVAIAHFEWAKLHKISTAKMAKQFSNFLEVIDSLEFMSRKDLMDRIKEVEEFCRP